MGEKPQEVTKHPETPRDPQEIRKEIEETRDQLEKKVDVLAAQLKQGVEDVRNVGIKIGGIVLAGLVGILTLRRLRKR